MQRRTLVGEYSQPAIFRHRRALESQEVSESFTQPERLSARTIVGQIFFCKNQGVSESMNNWRESCVGLLDQYLSNPIASTRITSQTLVVFFDIVEIAI